MSLLNLSELERRLKGLRGDKRAAEIAQYASEISEEEREECMRCYEEVNDALSRVKYKAKGLGRVLAPVITKRQTTLLEDSGSADFDNKLRLRYQIACAIAGEKIETPSERLKAINAGLPRRNNQRESTRDTPLKVKTYGRLGHTYAI